MKKVFTCEKHPELKPMSQSKWNRHLLTCGKEKKIKKDRKIRRDIKSFCGSCNKVIHSNWKLHRQQKHKDNKVKTTPTWQRLAEPTPSNTTTMFRNLEFEMATPMAGAQANPLDFSFAPAAMESEESPVYQTSPDGEEMKDEEGPDSYDGSFESVTLKPYIRKMVEMSDSALKM